jgi:hypothetical protein
VGVFKEPFVESIWKANNLLTICFLSLSSCMSVFSNWQKAKHRWDLYTYVWKNKRWPK